jgi:hypothetical protein
VEAVLLPILLSTPPVSAVEVVLVEQLVEEVEAVVVEVTVIVLVQSVSLGGGFGNQLVMVEKPDDDQLQDRQNQD